MFLILAGCANAASAAPSEDGPRRQGGLPNIVLITLDTTRSDRMGFLGSTRGLTPNLDALARQSVVFSRAYAQVPLTTPSHAAIFTGTYPQFNHVDYMGQPLTKDLPHLPDLLKHHGYRTAAFVGSIIIDDKSLTAAGFRRGFDIYDAPFHNKVKGEDRYTSIERRAGAVVESALHWLEAHRQGPVFVWIHCYDPHDPYDPPEPYKTRYASEPYDGEIAYMDSAMGTLFAGLKKLGVYDGALIAVMADHGEGLGEHGEHHHGIFLYDETVHVPLLFKLAENRFARKKIDSRVRLVDVAPTILEEVGITVPAAMQGESLVPLVTPGARATAAVGVHPDRPVYSESDYAQREFGWSRLRSWRSGKYLYVDSTVRELYDQASDPGALHNLAENAKAVSDTMQSQADEFRRETSRSPAVRSSLSIEQSETLRSLGYVGNDSPTSAEAGTRGVDPKGRMEVADLFDQALLLMQDDDFEDAIPKLQAVLKQEPNTALAYVELGRAYVDSGDPQRALPPLRTAVQMLPDDGLARFLLGRALVETGDWDAAVPQFEAVLARSPNSPQLHFYLAVLYQKSQRVPEAIREFKETLKREPNNFRANLLLGRLLGMQGNAAEALPYLRQAVKLDQKSVEAHSFLANVYTELGQATAAELERTKAEQLKSGSATR